MSNSYWLLYLPCLAFALISSNPSQKSTGCDSYVFGGSVIKYVRLHVSSYDAGSTYCSSCLQWSETAGISPSRQCKPLLCLTQMASSADTLGLSRADNRIPLCVYGQRNGSRTVFARIFPTGLGQPSARFLRTYSPRDCTHKGAPPEGE